MWYWPCPDEHRDEEHWDNPYDYVTPVHRHVIKVAAAYELGLNYLDMPLCNYPAKLISGIQLYQSARSHCLEAARVPAAQPVEGTPNE